MEGTKNWSGTVVTGLKRSATCTVRGAIAFNSSTHLPPSVGSLTVKPVMLRPGRVKFATKPLPIGSDTPVNTMGIVRVRGRAPITGVVTPRIASGRRSTSSFPTSSSYPRHRRPAKFDPEIAAFRPPQLRERTSKHCEPRLRNPIALRIAHQYADAVASGSAAARAPRAATAAAPPRSDMNSRRCMCSPEHALYDKAKA